MKKVLKGDLYERVGSNIPKFINVIGNFGDNLEINRYGKRFLDFCESSNIIITSTLFKHKNIHLTFHKILGRIKNLLD